MDVDGPGDSVDVLVHDCKFNMRLRMADSAWEQVEHWGCFVSTAVCLWSQWLRWLSVTLQYVSMQV